MKYVTVVFETEDEHNIDERLRELELEMKRVQESSEVGLVLKSFILTDKVPTIQGLNDH